MCTYKQYLSKYNEAHPFNKTESPVLDIWNGLYNNFPFNEISNNDFKGVLLELKEEYPGGWSRTDVFKEFSKDLYKGYVAAMLWGGLGLMDRRHLVSAMGTEKEKIVKICEKAKAKLTKAKLTKGDIKSAYRFFCGKLQIDKVSGKIPGIGESYFTKLLYFLRTETKGIQPLIYDNQLKRVHAALLKDKGIVNGYFSIGYDSKNHFCVKQQTRRNNAEHWDPFGFYYDYLTRMGKLSNQYGITPGKMEECVFGKKLRSRNIQGWIIEEQDNPRAFVRRYLDPAQQNANTDITNENVLNRKDSSSYEQEKKVPSHDSSNPALSRKPNGFPKSIKYNCGYRFQYKEQTIDLFIGMGLDENKRRIKVCEIRAEGKESLPREFSNIPENLFPNKQHKNYWYKKLNNEDDYQQLLEDAMTEINKICKCPLSTIFYPIS